MSGFATMAAAYLAESERRAKLQGGVSAAIRSLNFVMADAEKLTVEELRIQLDDVVRELETACAKAEPKQPSALDAFANTHERRIA